MALSPLGDVLALSRFNGNASHLDVIDADALAETLHSIALSPTPTLGLLIGSGTNSGVGPEVIWADGNTAESRRLISAWGSP